MSTLARWGRTTADAVRRLPRRASMHPFWAGGRHHELRSYSQRTAGTSRERGEQRARYLFRAITAIRPTRKSSVLRDIRRVMTPYLEPGESIEVCAVLYSGPLDFGSGWVGTGFLAVFALVMNLIGAIRAIRHNRNVQVYYAAVTGRRVVMVEVSMYVRRRGRVALSDSREGAPGVARLGGVAVGAGLAQP